MKNTADIIINVIITVNIIINASINLGSIGIISFNAPNITPGNTNIFCANKIPVDQDDCEIEVVELVVEDGSCCAPAGFPGAC